MRRRALAALSVASAAVPGEVLLLRDYIQKSLYDPIHGYFSNSKSPVLAHGIKIKLRELRSRVAYQQVVAETYANNAHGWMTPVELFSPFFSRAVANRIQSVAQSDQNINIIEIGAGRGTLAADMLEYWSEHSPDFLQNVTYNVVEISPALADLQSNVLHPWVTSGHAKIHNMDAITWFHSLLENADLSKQFQSTPCHIIAMEVLDNLPHDLVRVNNKGFEQAAAVLGNSSNLGSSSVELEWISEIDETTNAAINAFDCLNPAKDTTVSALGFQHSSSSFFNRARESFETLLSGGRREIWIPTASFQLMQAMVTALPHAQMTISDFDSFPGALPGENGPVVQSVERGSAIVYDSVVNAPFGKVDIMFPTNFRSLQESHEALSCEGFGRDNHLYRIASQQQFFEEHSSEQAIKDSTCLDGYNPVLQDFENASFLLVDARGPPSHPPPE